MDMESRLADRVTVQQVFRRAVLLNHWNSRKQTNTGFQRLSYQILKGCNSYTMFSACIFQLRACLKRPFSSGDVRCKNFPECPSEPKDLSGCTRVALSMPPKFTSTHRHWRKPLPQFSFPLIFLPLQGHPLLTPRIQFLWSQGYEGDFNFTRGWTGRD